jgi:hypothetical protein
MKTASEPLTKARDRIAANGGGDVTSVRRLVGREGAKTPLPFGEGKG